MILLVAQCSSSPGSELKDCPGEMHACAQYSTESPTRVVRLGEADVWRLCKVAYAISSWAGNSLCAHNNTCVL